MGSNSRPSLIDPYNDSRAEQRALDSTERRARARAAIVANGGRSAPQASPPSGLTTGSLGTGESSLTPESTWRSMFRRDPAKEAAANAAVAGSRVRPTINTLNAYSDGAIAASPAPYMPSSAPLVGLPDMKAPAGMTPAQGDAWQTAARARDHEMLAPGGLSRYDPTPRQAPRRQISAYDPIGTEISNEAGNAYLGAPNADLSPTLLSAAGTGATLETPYGTASSRTPNWQEQVAADHPAIHQAGSPENLAFVAAVKNAQANGEPIDQSTMSALSLRVTQSEAAKRAAKTAPMPRARDVDNRRLNAYA